MFSKKCVMGISLSLVLGMLPMNTYASENGETLVIENGELEDVLVEDTGEPEETPEEETAEPEEAPEEEIGELEEIQEETAETDSREEELLLEEGDVKADEENSMEVVAPGLEGIIMKESAEPVLALGDMLLSGNVGKNNYSYNWYHVINSFLTKGDNGGYIRVQYASDGNVYIEEYSQKFALKSYKILPKELEKFGGFYNDGQYYYLVFGQDNMAQDNNREVIRIVKYSHDWQRLGAASVYGANTYKPFDAGSLRMDSYGGALYIRTAHTMYTSTDGLNHQSCMTIKVQMSDMSVADIAYAVQNSSAGYVSHSFNQFIKIDGGTILALDHGDAYPRSAVLSRYSGDKLGAWGTVSTVNTLIYEGSIGQNRTNATLGGFEVSDTAYLTAGSSAPQDGTGSTGKNIYVTATSKDNFTKEGTRFTWITNYTGNSTACGNPQLVEINKNRYLLLWMENQQLKYVFLNGDGGMSDDIKTGNANLSDCQPVFDGKRVVWYVVDGQDFRFYTIDAVTGELQGHVPSEAYQPGDDDTEDWDDLNWLFDDVAGKEGDWKYDNIKYISERGIMGGVGGSNLFKPNEPLTRAMFATVLYRMAGEPDVEYTDKFTDVPNGQWYSDAILWANQKGIVSGYSDGSGRYGINDNITREQIAKMLHIYGEVMGYDVSGKASIEHFTDKESVSAWAVEHIQWSVDAEMISGKPNDAEGSSYRIDPKGEATRAECAKMLTMFLKKYK